MYPTRRRKRSQMEMLVIIRKLQTLAEITAGDGTILREILRPDDEGVSSRYSLAHAKLPRGQKSQQHRLNSTEVYFIMEGEGVMQIDGERQPVAPGDCVYIPPGAVQHIENHDDVELVFLCVVDPAWRKEDEEIL